GGSGRSCRVPDDVVDVPHAAADGAGALVLGLAGRSEVEDLGGAVVAAARVRGGGGEGAGGVGSGGRDLDVLTPPQWPVPAGAGGVVPGALGRSRLGRPPPVEGGDQVCRAGLDLAPAAAGDDPEWGVVDAAGLRDVEQWVADGDESADAAHGSGGVDEVTGRR